MLESLGEDQSGGRREGGRGYRMWGGVGGGVEGESKVRFWRRGGVSEQGIRF